jgi:hypothetical protein
MRQIAMESINTIPNYPIFYGIEPENKMIMIIYHKDKPIGLNVSFNFEMNKKRCVHIGLVLISEKYKGKGIQKITPLNTILWGLFENNWLHSIYITDLGRSASGLKIFNKILTNSYPNPSSQNSKPSKEYLEIASHFVNCFKQHAGISSIAQFDPNTFIIQDSNDGENGGAVYLVPFLKQIKTSSLQYLNYFSNLGEHDEVISVGKIRPIQLFWKIITNQI